MGAPADGVRKLPTARIKFALPAAVGAEERVRSDLVPRPGERLVGLGAKNRAVAGQRTNGQKLRHAWAVDMIGVEGQADDRPVHRIAGCHTVLLRKTNPTR